MNPGPDLDTPLSLLMNILIELVKQGLSIGHAQAAFLLLDLRVSGWLGGYVLRGSFSECWRMTNMTVWISWRSNSSPN